MAHEGGKDGAYSFKFSSPDTQLSCEFIDTDDWTSVGKNHGDSVNLAMLLPDKKLFKIRIEPDDLQNSVTINVEISYTIYRNIGQISIDNIAKGTAVRVNDRFTMHFRNSIENNCTWRSSDPSVVSVGYTSGQLTAHKLGSATITFTNPCGTSYSTVVRCVLDHVYITPDGTGYNKVAFATSGRIWHCVYCDTIYESPQNIANATHKRNNMNYFANTDEDGNPLSENKNIFSDNELKLLYAIDPLGVANYIERYTSEWDVTKAINKKDAYFELFFGRKPLCFARNIRDEWISVDKPEGNLISILSESELIMGKHVVWDASTWRDLIIGTVNLIINFISISAPTGTLLKAFFEAKDTLDNVVTIFSLCTCESFNDVLSEVSGMPDGSDILDEMYENTDIDWVGNLISVFSSFADFFNSVNFENSLYRHKINYCIKDNNYDIHIEPIVGKPYVLEDYRDLLQITD